MNLVDTHCHIHSQDYALEPDEVITRAQAAGVGRLLCVGTTAEDSKLAVAFTQSRPQCYASIGLHPHDAVLGEPAFATLRTLLDDAAQSAKIVAIGECGLDYFYGHSTPADQEKAMRFQIELALEYNLPMIFHVREAFKDFWPIFDSYPDLTGVLHSFTDTQENLDIALGKGLYIGVNGIATFTKNNAQLAMYRKIPSSRVVFETDAPYLTPVPLRGKVNESANVLLICNFLADLQNSSVEELAMQSTQNAINLFRLTI